MTAYPYAAGADSEYDSWLSQYDYGKNEAQQQNTLRVGRTNEDYKSAYTSLEKQGAEQKKNVDTSMLGRGMFQSGERTVKQGEVDTNVTTAKGMADQAYQRQLADASGDLQRALATLDLTNEQQVGAAVGRKGARDAEAARQAESDRQFQAEQTRRQEQVDYDRGVQQRNEQAAADAETQRQAEADQQAASDAAWRQQQEAAQARYRAAAAPVVAAPPPPPIRVAAPVHKSQAPRGAAPRVRQR